MAPTTTTDFLSKSPLSLLNMMSRDRATISQLPSSQKPPDCIPEAFFIPEILPYPPRPSTPDLPDQIRDRSATPPPPLIPTATSPELILIDDPSPSSLPYLPSPALSLPLSTTTLHIHRSSHPLPTQPPTLPSLFLLFFPSEARLLTTTFLDEFSPEEQEDLPPGFPYTDRSGLWLFMKEWVWGMSGWVGEWMEGRGRWAGVRNMT